MAKKNKEKLKKVLDRISYSDSGVKEVFKVAEKEMQKVADKLKEDAEIKTVEMAKKRMTEIREQVKTVFDYLDKLKEDLKKRDGELSSALNEKLFVLKDMMQQQSKANSGQFKGLTSNVGGINKEMDILRSEIQEVSSRKIEIPNYENQIKSIEQELKETVSSLRGETVDKFEQVLTESKNTVSELETEIKKLRTETMSALASKGGNMNRNILVGNNPSTLGRYTDLNVKAGSNVTLTYTNNDNLKTTDLTIAATGGSGTNRNISTVSVSSVVAAVASTDYVVIAGAGIQLTMPTAVGNTNLYTIKNKVASSILVAADGSETIDGDANIILATQYVSVDLISDNANWHIT